MYASTYVLIAMAYDRYTCICRPMQSCSWSYTRASCGILFAWLLAALISSPQLVLWKVQPVTVNDKIVVTCYALWSSKLEEGLYILYHAAGQFFLPFFILLVLYSSIFIAVSNSITYKNVSIQRERDLSDANLPFNQAKHSGASRKQHTTSNHDAVVVYVRSKHQGSSQNSSPLVSTKKYHVVDANKFTNMPSISFHNAHTRSSKHLSLKTDSTPIRQNFPAAKVFSKSKMKTLQLTLTVMIAYVLCTLPFYTSILVNFFVGYSFEKNSFKCKSWAKSAY